ncbi:MAG: HEAT repeat domain-containing protein [Pyrinomonadaceae bacterium]|nr:HEAT repeat domain-containing protein [Pyrinomonadaceae bacterium]
MSDNSLSNQSVASAIAKIRSEDTLIQNDGVQELMHIGPPAVSALLTVVGEQQAAQRGQAMYALSEIADPRAQPAFKLGLSDDDERVRSYSAVGLSRIGDADALKALIQTINDAPDPLHLDLTPSVFALGSFGLDAAGELLELLLDEDQDTRLHAQRALEMIVGQRHGFKFGRGYPTPEAELEAQAEWQDNGNYDYAAPAAARIQSVEKLRDWPRKRKQ